MLTVNWFHWLVVVHHPLSRSQGVGKWNWPSHKLVRPKEKGENMGQNPYSNSNPQAIHVQLQGFRGVPWCAKEGLPCCIVVHQLVTSVTLVVLRHNQPPSCALVHLYPGNDVRCRRVPSCHGLARNAYSYGFSSIFIN